MQRNPLRRISPKQRAYGIVGGVFVAMVLIALLAGTPQNKAALAQVFPTTPPGSLPCSAPLGNVTTCNFATTTGVVPGGTMGIELTNPTGVAMIGISVPAWCTTSPTPSSGAPTAFVSIICPVASPGILAGTVISELIQLPSPIPNPPGGLFITQSVVYNQNGPSPNVVVQATLPMSCGDLSPTIGATVVCGPIAMPTAIGPGYQAVFQINGATATGVITGQSLFVAPDGVPPYTGAAADPYGGSGGCPLATPLPTSNSFPSGPLSIVYACGPGQSVSAPPAISITVTNANGDPGTPSIIALAEGPGSVPIPDPTVTNLVFSLVNTASLSPTATGTSSGGGGGSASQITGQCTPPDATGTALCTFTTATAVAAGGTMTIQLTNPTGAAISNVTGLPAGCTLQLGQTTSLVTVACAIASLGIPQGTTITQAITGAAGAAFITEYVTSNANGGGQPAGVPVVVTNSTCTVATTTTYTCTGTPAGPAQEGQTLSMTITAASGQKLFVAAGGVTPVPDGSCPLATPLPTGVSGPGGVVSIAFVCGPGETAPVGPIQVTVTNANGVSGNPTEVTTVNTPGSLPLPAPTTASVVFVVGAVTPTVTPITPTVAPTQTVPAGVSFCSMAVTPTPANCFTFNSNCVNPAGVGLPQPALATGAPAISTNGPYTGYIGQPLQLKGSAVPPFGSLITTCVWDFGDTSAAAHFLSPTHTYAVSGTYTATLTVTALTASCTGATNAGGATCTCTNSGNGVTTCSWTVVATTSVTIGALPPLCQQPLLPSLTGLSACGGGGCPATSFNNQCRPICPLTTETLLPNQCPGPATGNQVTINGPLQVAVNQPVIINANINLPSTSDLLPGDYLRFDFGDGAVITNVGPLAFNPNGTATPSTITIGSLLGTPVTGTSSAPSGPQVLCADHSAATFLGPGTCANNGGIQPGQPAPAGAVFPASTQAAHAYTQAGTYTVTVEVTFSDGTTAVAKTTVTVAGQGASLPTAAPAPSGPPVVATSVALQAGCNTVTLTFPDGTPIDTVAAAIQGTTLSAIYETPANAPELAYYADPTLTSNLATVQHGDQASICVQGSGNLVQPAS